VNAILCSSAARIARFCYARAINQPRRDDAA
jgi:hypothetical protein